MANPNCDTCGAECIQNGITTGYGTDSEGRKHCFKCCAEQDAYTMRTSDRITLYVTDREVTNWPGSLRLPIIEWQPYRHPWCRTPGRSVRVRARDGSEWYGRHASQWSQLITLRRAKHELHA